MDGIINIHKPAGPTSYKIVSAVKRLTGEKRAGHAGTLDPAASGVLPVCLGKATRVTEFLMGHSKAYRAEIRLGVTTDTYDAAGQVTGERDISDIDSEKLEAAIMSFRGVIEQTPPSYSAVKHRGKPLYEFARKGIEVERKSRPVTVHSIEILDWQLPVVTVDVVCSKGTYIRSLAHDLGQVLGCGAHLKSLIRTRYGIFDIANSIPVTELENLVRLENWEGFVHSIDSVLQDYPAVVVNEKTEDSIINGKSVSVVPEKYLSGNETTAGNYYRAYSLDGRFLAILRYKPGTDTFHPKKVLV